MLAFIMSTNSTGLEEVSTFLKTDETSHKYDFAEIAH